MIKGKHRVHSLKGIILSQIPISYGKLVNQYLSFWMPICLGELFFEFMPMYQSKGNSY